MVIKVDNRLPKRKANRLKEYDYSQAGVYFVTICTQGRRGILSSVCSAEASVPVGQGLAPADPSSSVVGRGLAPADPSSSVVGRGLAPADPSSSVVGRGLAPADPSSSVVGQGLAPAEIHLSQIGIIAEQQLLKLEERFPDISIDKYVIMPNHIHILLSINRLAAGASPCPTLSDVICAFKSLTTRICRAGEIFQTSFYDHIVRDNNDYLAVWQYIDNNPHKWELDKYYQS